MPDEIRVFCDNLTKTHPPNHHLRHLRIEAIQFLFPRHSVGKAAGKQSIKINFLRRYGYRLMHPTRD